MNIQDIKTLRARTGCGVTEARTALHEAGGDLERAAAAVRQRQQERRPDRAAEAGAVFAYVHHDGRLGAMLVLSCATDFAARSQLFRELGEALAMHIAALNPPDAKELLAQPFVKDGEKTVGQLVAEATARTGEPVQVREFRCFRV
jgi:elongation factor Ts